MSMGPMRRPVRWLTAAALTGVSALVSGQQAEVPGTSVKNSPPGAPIAPDWAYPQSIVHNQVGPPAGFHRDTRIDATPIGVFEGQADVGGAVVSGSASFAGDTYMIRSAGYNIWYTRDEFRFLFKRLSGNVSLAAEIAYPAGGFSDHKSVSRWTTPRRKRWSAFTATG